MTARQWIDVGVLCALSLLAVLGFESAFGSYNFLLAGLGGLIVGTGAAVISRLLSWNVLNGVLLAIVGYFLLGTPFAMPNSGFLVVLPSLSSLAGLATGAVYGWADILTLSTPVEAPYYMPVLPYFAVWLVALIGTMLATRWLPKGKRTVGRSAVLLIGPALLFIASILLGTDEAVFPGVRGVLFAAAALLWLGWRSVRTERVSSDGATRLRVQKLTGTAVVVVTAVLFGSVAGTLIAPPQESRFVLRDEIQPPFDPLEFASPLAGFRKYTKDLAETPLFSVSGLQSGDRIRLASMDSYDGKLWNVAGPNDADAESGFSLAGETLSTPTLFTPGSAAQSQILVTGYSDVWLPLGGFASRLRFGDAVGKQSVESLRINADSGTAMLVNGVQSGYSYTVDVVQQEQFSDDALANIPAAEVPMSAIVDPPDIVVAKSVEFAGTATTPIAQLRAIEGALRGAGFLSHGLASDAVPSRAGHGADRMIELFTRSQMVGDQEQYASAMALMARNLGYPARVVMGFAPTISSDGLPSEVLGADVTAWVEVPFEGVGWVAFDPTPEQRDAPQDQVPEPKSEPQPQVRQPPRSENRIDELLTTVETDKSDDELPDPPVVIPLWVWIVSGSILIPLLLIGVPLLVLTLLKLRRRRKRRRDGSGDAQIAGAWEELSDGYAELGFAVPRGVTRTQLAQALEAQLGEQGVGEARAVRTDTGPIRVVTAAERPSSTIRLQPLAEAIDRAVFGGATITDVVVSKHWRDSDEAMQLAQRSVGRTRRWISRFRLRARRDWNSVNLLDNE